MAKKIEKQGHLLQIRLTAEDWERVQKMSAKATLTYTELIRGFINSWWDQTQSLEAVAAAGTVPASPDPASQPEPPHPVHQAKMDHHVRPDGTIIRDWHGNP